MLIMLKLSKLKGPKAAVLPKKPKTSSSYASFYSFSVPAYLQSSPMGQLEPRSKDHHMIIEKQFIINHAAQFT